jgi:hypothetical protein
MTPIEATKPENQKKLRLNYSLNRMRKINKIENSTSRNRYVKSDLKEGQLVKIPNHKTIFSKESLNNTWSVEIFRIERINDYDFPITFSLIDLLGEKIEGKFYREELLGPIPEEILDKDFKINKVYKKNKKYYVSYVGYSDKFDNEISKQKYLELRK